MQAADQRKIREEPAIESVVSALLGRMISTIEKSESKEVNEENIETAEKKPSN